MRIFLFVFCIYSVQGLTQTAFPFDFETSETTPVFYDFEQAATTVVPNPNVNDNNPSATVAKMVRNTGGQIWAGSLVQFDEYFDFTEIGAIKMSVHAPVSGSVIKLKLEGLAVSELDAITTVANDWEVLEWDFTGVPAGTFNAIAFMLDFGLYGDGSALSTFYFDNVELFDGAGNLIQVDLPITHEDEGVHYQTTSFAGNFSGLAVDPVDDSNAVMKVMKHWLALDYSGTTMSTPAGLATPISFEPGFTTMSVDVYSPTPGIAVRLKAEEYLDMSHSVETQVVTTTSYEWETLTFDFSQPVPGTQSLNPNFDYTILSIFFDFGSPGYLSGSTTYYYDNVIFNGNPASSAELTSGRGGKLYPTFLSASEPLFIDGLSDWTSLKIFNAGGSLIRTQWVLGGAAISSAGLQPGMYLAQWESDGLRHSERFIITQ
ncbi:MAG: T9SS type A sorting domain-containing protein [Flavobacteriales bacterium]